LANTTALDSAQTICSPKLGALSRGVAETMAALGAPDAPEPPAVERHPVATAALERLAAGRWGDALRSARGVG